jgi:hypothetical protein
MYEGSRKYAVRSTSRLSLGNGQHDGGSYTFDAALQVAPIAFRQHTAQLWRQHLAENPRRRPDEVRATELAFTF